MAVDAAEDRAHHRRRLTGRDPSEAHRSATPLELLFDLTFVVAFGIAADELAHYLAEGHVWTGDPRRSCSRRSPSRGRGSTTRGSRRPTTPTTGSCRLATMVQMVGVIVLALGLEQAFASIDEGDVLDNGVMVAGYVVMRVPMVFLWARAARHDPARRPAAMRLHLDDLGRAGLLGRARDRRPADRDDVRDRRGADRHRDDRPAHRERRNGGTPWHAHHIAERYGLLVIITLGEGIIGTVASINAVVHGSDRAGRSTPGSSRSPGIGLIFATWWTYFAIPWAEVLAAAPRAVVHLGLRPHRDLRRRSPRSARACTSPPTTSSTRRRSARPAPS